MSTLLATKLQIPPSPPRVIQRTRLIDKLERAIPQFRLTLVAAPAGYGKTTMLAQWARASQMPVAWLSLSQEDDDLARFFRYTLAAWEAVQPSVRESRLALLLEGMSPDSEAVLSAFLNCAAELSDHTVIVLDDYHQLQADAVHDALDYLLDHLPPRLHFVVAGRGRPAVSLARYRARQQLFDVGAGDLRFTQQESADFLREHMGLELGDGEVSALHQQLEGWIAGLQLVGLSLRRQPEPVEHISGNQRHIADYLSEEVLDHLPEEMQQLLVQISIVDRLCGPLCNAITRREDGQALLERLERESLFLVALDERRRWFRFHQLFADYLRRRLRERHPEDEPNLHRRAARWYLAKELPEPAFRHAVAADDVQLVLRIFDLYVQRMLIGGQFRQLQQWLDALPGHWESEHPLIGLVRTGLLLFRGQLEACLRSVAEVEQRLLTTEVSNRAAQLARVEAVRCSIACFQNDLNQAEAFAERALHELPDEDAFFRAIIHGSLGDIYRRHGRWRKAEASYDRMLDFIDTPGLGVQSVHVYGALADLELRRGKLRAAADYWQSALTISRRKDSRGRLRLPLVGWVHIRLAELHYEWNQLAEARDHLDDGLVRAEVGGDVRALIAGYLLAGRLKLTEGDDQAAAEQLERVRPHVERAHFVHWRSRFERLQLEIWLVQDRLRTAVNWSDKMLRDEVLEERPESEFALLAVARVLIVKGDQQSSRQAAALLERLLEAAQAEGRMGVLIEGYALQALAHERRDNQTAAMVALERALRLAEPEGYRRRLADLGLAMARLLQAARSRGMFSDYVDELLSVFDDDGLIGKTPGASLPEPLTDRELDVLQLLAAGLTNREIGERLVISPETVKKHASHIYGKLDVANRTEAAARARELALLE
ncbi:MAG: LuxR C-terminal-related transcriptional regulator [Candidatus Promineifilaceae bacterium]|nr:LuxR C-terminal-related transcriptional regulator [Candidatus Promineifilaceae bacterium]